jgi:hypothetical protein
VLLFSFDPLPPHEARNNKAAAAGTKNSLFMSLFLWLFKENAKLRLITLLENILSNFTPVAKIIPDIVIPSFLKDWLRFNKLIPDFKKMFTFAIL